MQIKLFSNSEAKYQRGKNVSKNARYIFRSWHGTAQVQLKFDKLVRGLGLWKLNNCIIQDYEYEQGTSDLITGVRADTTDISDSRVRFDYSIV